MSLLLSLLVVVRLQDERWAWGDGVVPFITSQSLGRYCLASATVYIMQRRWIANCPRRLRNSACSCKKRTQRIRERSKRDGWTMHRGACCQEQAHTQPPRPPPPRHCSDKPGERCFPKAERLKAAPKKLQRCTTQRACVQVCVCVRERERERGREREVERERGREREREVERERESCTSMTHTHTQHSTTPS